MEYDIRRRKPSVSVAGPPPVTRARSRSIVASRTKPTLARPKDTTAHPYGLRTRSGRPDPAKAIGITKENASDGLTKTMGTRPISRKQSSALDTAGNEPAKLTRPVDPRRRPGTLKPSSKAAAKPSHLASDTRIPTPTTKRVLPSIGLSSKPTSAALSRAHSPAEDVEHWKKQTDFLRREMYVAEKAYVQLLEVTQESSQLGRQLLNENLRLRRTLQAAEVPLPSGLLDYQNIDLDRLEHQVLGGAQGLSSFPSSAASSQVLPVTADPSPAFASLDNLAMVEEQLGQLDVSTSDLHALAPLLQDPALMELGEPRHNLKPMLVDRATSPRPDSKYLRLDGKAPAVVATANRSLLPVPVRRPSFRQPSASKPCSTRSNHIATGPMGDACTSVGLVSSTATVAVTSKVNMATQTESYEICHPDTLYNLEIDNDYYREANRQLRRRLANIISKHNALVELCLEERERQRRKKERQAQLQETTPALANPTRRPSTTAIPATTCASTGMFTTPAVGLLPPESPEKPLLFQPHHYNHPTRASGLNTMVADIEESVKKIAAKFSDSPLSPCPSPPSSPHLLKQQPFHLANQHSPTKPSLFRKMADKSPMCASKTLHMDPLQQDLSRALPEY
ncbi:hypothetical protein H4R34_002001 [Dimargaris verticillata]|uniref:Uncharacterized protein n=1 Tax=Dimargaris verticillata TaxID=2761393 RepID=A0A9W8EDZ0_9FUNG|nr:hypothetical protein H4R34_002001 [Dimargaris verticillata]